MCILCFYVLYIILFLFLIYIALYFIQNNLLFLFNYFLLDKLKNKTLTYIYQCAMLCAFNAGNNNNNINIQPPCKCFIITSFTTFFDLLIEHHTPAIIIIIISFFFLFFIGCTSTYVYIHFQFSTIRFILLSSRLVSIINRNNTRSTRNNMSIPT